MSKTITFLATILAAQLILLAVVTRDPHRVAEKPAFFSVDTSTIEQVKIRNKDGEVTLKRAGANWKLTQPVDFPANPSYIKTLLEKLAEMRVETFITNKEASYQQYELDDLAAIYVEVGGGGKTEAFYCGKTSDSYSQVFIRREGSKDVLLVSGSPRTSLTREPTDWRDKRILELDRTLIDRVVIQLPTERNELVRTIKRMDEDTTLTENDTTWVVNPSRGAPFAPDDSQLNRVMNALRRMNAIQFMDAGKDTIPDFSRPELTVETFLEDGRRFKLDFIPKTDSDNRWVCRKDDNETTVYIIYQSTVNNLKKTAADLKGEKKDEKKGS